MRRKVRGTQEAPDFKCDGPRAENTWVLLIGCPERKGDGSERDPPRPGPSPRLRQARGLFRAANFMRRTLHRNVAVAFFYDSLKAQTLY